MMIVKVQESTIVRPSEETPKKTLWTSNIDQIFRVHIPSIYFFRSDGSSSFFDVSVLKEALSKALVPFYPVAGRLKRDKDGRLEIECNGEGVLFVEAHTDSYLDDLGDFTPTRELSNLIPKLEKNKDIFSSPLLLLQVTYFKCGGVSLGVGAQHTLVDGVSGTHFINSWARVARGLDVKIPPFLDRTLLRARNPPNPTFPHIEHQPPPYMKSSPKIHESETSPNNTAICSFKISRDFISRLKEKCKEGTEPATFSSYVVLAGHVWRCVCKARGLEDDQESSVSIVVDGRSRLNPPLPTAYMGNALFHVTPRATSGDLLTKQLSYAVRKVNDTLGRADDEYLRSAIDYLELQPDLSVLVRGPHTFRCPNLGFTSWNRMPIHDADFGWGRPVYMGPGAILFEGLAYVLPSPANDGNLSLAISLQPHHMERFKEILYDL